jgi:hypothetical protein
VARTPPARIPEAITAEKASFLLLLFRIPHQSYIRNGQQAVFHNRDYQSLENFA